MAIHIAPQSRTSSAGHVLVVDDEVDNVRLTAALLGREGYAVSTAENGREALDAVWRGHPDLVLMDVVMPEQNGLEACRALKQDSATRLIPIVMLTARCDIETKIRAIEAGADDFVTKPFNVSELRARVQALIRIKRYTDNLDSAQPVIVSLALTIEARDTTTEGHCQRLAKYATALGKQLGMGDEDVSALEGGGFLHDIGKVGIADAILMKPGRLTPAEYSCMKQHTLIGDRLCGELRSLRRVRPIVRSHHERLDGSGYPDGLRGDAIPLAAQIIGIVDVFDALTTARPYKAAVDVGRADDELVREVERGWRRRDLVEAFSQLRHET